MKLLLRIALILSLCLEARAVTVTGSMIDSGFGTWGKRVRFLPFTQFNTPAFLAQGTNTVVPVPVPVDVTNGVFSAHLVGGWYQFDAGSPNPLLTVLAPLNDTNTYTLNDLARLAVNASMFAGSNIVVTVNVLSTNALTNGQSGVTLSIAAGDGSGLTNVSTSTSAVGPSANTWVWWASTGSDEMQGRVEERVGLWVSPDGINWTQTTAPEFYDPNQYTNNVLGPIAREFATFYTNGTYWAVYNFDPYNVGSTAQGLGLARSSDGTNWVREAVLYPFGTTNSQGDMFAATWFVDTDSSVHLVMSYGTNGFATGLRAWQMSALDQSMTNWGAPVLIDNDASYSWDGTLTKVGSTYYLYYLSNSGWKRATNSNLTSLFTQEHTGSWMNNTGYTNGVSCGTISTANFEGMSVLNVSGSHWRAYARFPDSVMSLPGGPIPGRQMWYADSYDNQAGFGPWTNLTIAAYWHAPGIAVVPAKATNTVAVIGVANQGQVNVAAPLLRARNLQSDNLRVLNGVTAKSGYFAGSLGAQRGTFSSLVIDPSVPDPGSSGGWGFVTLNAGNIILDTNGTLEVAYFAGNGSNLTQLPASQLVGTVPIANLPTNYVGFMQISVPAPELVLSLNANAWQTLTNYKNGNFSSGFILNTNTGWMTNQFAGWYRIVGRVGFDAAGTASGEVFDLRVNNGAGTGAVLNAIGGGTMPVTLLADASASISVDKVLYLPANTGLQLQVQCEINTGVTFSVREADFIITKQ